MLSQRGGVYTSIISHSALASAITLLYRFGLPIASVKLHYDKVDFQTIASRPIELAFVFAGLAFIGPGKFSIDKD